MLASRTMATENLIVRGQSPESNLWTGWVTGYGLGGNAQGNGNAGGARYSNGGTSFGAARRIDDLHHLGFFGSVSESHTRAADLVQSVESQSVLLGGFIVGHDGVHYYIIAGAGGIDDYDTRRTVTLAAPATMTSSFSGSQAVAYAERGWDLRLFNFDFSRLQPYGALQYVFVNQEVHVESGPLAASIDAIHAHSLRSILGCRASLDRIARNGWRWSPSFRASWIHEFLDTTRSVTSTFLAGGPSFTVTGTDLGRDWALLGPALTLNPTDRLTLYVDYNLQMNTHQVFHLGSGGLQYVW